MEKFDNIQAYKSKGIKFYIWSEMSFEELNLTVCWFIKDTENIIGMPFQAKNQHG